MPTVAEPALETAESSIADTIPEASKSGLPNGSLNDVASKFWDEPAAEPAKKVEPAKEEPKAVVTTDDAPAPGFLAAKYAAKAAKAAAPAAPAEAKVEPAKVEPVVAEEHPEDKIQLDAKSSPKARDNFEALRTITKAERTRAAVAEKKAAEYQAKLEAASHAPVVDASEVEKLRKEKQELSDKLLLIDTQNHPVFQNQYVAPRQQAIQNATEILKAAGKDADLAALIEKPRGEIGKALTTLLEGVPQFDQTEISANIQRAYSLRQDELKALGNARELQTQVRQKNATTHIAAFDRVWQAASAGVAEMLEPADIPANATQAQRQGIEAYNAEMGTLREKAARIATGTNSYESIAEASIKAAAYDLHVKNVLPRIGAEVSAMLDVIKAQKAEIDGYRSRNPNKGISASPAKETKSAAPKNIEEAAEAAWR